MNVRQALKARKSVRAYLDRETPRHLIETLLDAARHAPSGANTQPWQAAVVTGKTKQQLQTSMEAAFRSGERGKMDYQYYPEQWFSPFTERRLACGVQLYEALEIGRADREKRTDQWAANYRAFDAPAMLFFFMDRRVATGSFIDFGMFLQSLMLAAVDMGMATCPEAALGEYPDLVRDKLGYDDGMLLLCGMALGYADETHPANSYRTPRQEVNSFTRFFD